MRMIPLNHGTVLDSQFDYNRYIRASELDDFDAAFHWLRANPLAKAFASFDGVARPTWTTTSLVSTVTNDSTDGIDLDAQQLALELTNDLVLADVYRDDDTDAYYLLELYVYGSDVQVDFDLVVYDTANSASSGSVISGSSTVSISIAATSDEAARKIYIVKTASGGQMIHANVDALHLATGANAQITMVGMRAARIVNQSSWLTSLLAHGGAWTTNVVPDTNSGAAGDLWDKDGATYGFEVAAGTPTHNVDNPETRINSWSFDGATDYWKTSSNVDVGEGGANALTAFTVTMAAKFDNSGGGYTGMLMQQLEGAATVSWQLRMESGTLVLEMYDTADVLYLAQIDPPAADAWIWIHGEYDGSQVQIYVNAKPGTAAAAVGKTVRQSSSGLLLLGAAVGPANFHTGRIAVPSVLSTSVSDSARKSWHAWAQMMTGIDFGHGSTEEVGLIP